jgi:SAM-dependent methyltransferase
MRPEEYDYMFRLEETFWWYVAMRRITDTVVASQMRSDRLAILDAGCGTGINLAHFASHGSHRVFGLDVSKAAIDFVRQRGFQTISQASIAEIPFASESFDLALSFDVLCQVPAPLVESGLREIQRVLKPGGSLFVRVPAFDWMRSSHDDAVESVHRFTRAEIVREMEKAGLAVNWISYANFFLFPAVLIRRVLKAVGIGAGSDVRPLPGAIGWIDPIFRKILESEAAFFRSGIRFPFGLSVICLARKP